jgi:hypothetical protein
MQCLESRAGLSSGSKEQGDFPMRRLQSRSFSVMTSVALLFMAANEGIAAGEGGTAEEAKAMLERAVGAVEKDEAAALAAFTAGTDGFRGPRPVCGVQQCRRW